MDDSLIDRVFLGEETRLYRTKAVLAYLDGPVYDFRSASVRAGNSSPTMTELPAVMPVRAEDSPRPIGFALVVQEGNRLMAEVTIDYASEERLLAETKALKLYAVPQGQIIGVGPAEGRGRPLDLHRPLTAYYVEMTGVVVTRRKPADERLAPLGEPVL